MKARHDLPVHSRGGSVRKTISVPAEISVGMAKHPEINWSKVAAKAFEEALDKLK